MKEKAKNILKYTLSLVVAGVLLYFCFREVEWKDFISILGKCKWSFVLLSVAFGILSFYLRAVRWRELLLPLDCATSRLTTFNAVNISYAVNLALPRVGELVRCGYITAHSSKDENGKRKAGFDKVFGTVVVDRGWDVVSMFLLLIIVLASMGSRFRSFISGLFVGEDGPLFEISASSLILALGAAAVAAVFLVWALRKKIPHLGKLWSFVEGIWRGVKSCLEMKGWWKFLLCTVLIWGCYWMMSVSTMWAVQGIDPASGVLSADTAAALYSLGMMDALFLMLAGSLSSLVPVPGGFGAYHYIITLTLSSMYGIPAEIGIIFATLSHEAQAVTQLFCGGISYLVETFRQK